MPLVRVEVRNEFGLGAPELYREANKEDPKEILEGVAVAGLVGVLRQLGDLAEFAADVFHGLQEEVGVTLSRSHKLMARVQRIEAALPPLEKTVLAQRSHLHFAYTAGSNWHTRPRCEQNHFIYSDVPNFIADSYEESRGPPRLHMLDRYDPSGPGSCLKKYSDPTFFRRASEASGEASTIKIPKNKKSRKTKKRSSWTQNGELSRGASLSYQSSRFSVGEQTSATQTTFTDDATVRSDSREQSNLDLRNGSGYPGGDFRPSYSTQFEEQDSGVSVSSPLKRRDSDFLDFNFLEGKVDGAYAGSKASQSQDHAGGSSSSVTWDEKAETMEPATPDYSHDGRQEDAYERSVEALPSMFKPTSKSDDAVNSEIMDVQSYNRALPTVGSGDIHLDDVESETDHFVDALNTIESESETDLECTKKREIKHYSVLEEKLIDGGQSELIRDNSESNVVKSDSLINGDCLNHPVSVSSKPSSASYNSNGIASKNELNSVSPVDEYSSAGMPGSDGSTETGCLIKDANMESDTNTTPVKFRENISGIPVINKTRIIVETQKPAPETTTVVSGAFWTNGGLLGLQPSKPPDWSKLNALSQNTLSNKDVNVCSSSKDLIRGDNVGIPDGEANSINLEEDSENAAMFRKPCWKLSPADLDVRPGKPSDSVNQKDASLTGFNVYANPEFKSATINQEANCRSSSRMFELSNRLDNTGSNKKLLSGADQNSISGRYQNGNAFEQKNIQNGFQTSPRRAKDVFGMDSIILSPSSSPPLAHMKISLQPIDGFETSKLKLKFSDGDTSRESSRDIFPSFQLVPEVLVTRHNTCSDSENDSFSDGSSHSSGGDCHSQNSDSNSEQWESSESPKSKDPSLYNSLREISLTDSVSTIPENENGVQNSQSCRSFDLRSLDTLNQSFREELRNVNNLKELVEPQIKSIHVPPPLPPVQWMGMKADAVENNYNSMPEGSKYVFDVEHSESIIKPKPAPFNHDQSIKATTQKSKSFNSLKSNGREAKGNTTDEMGDFLHQIRAKSFNLRPILTSKTILLPKDGSNVQVTAILEKANAIRQAVASDDGEDSNWSDA